MNKQVRNWFVVGNYSEPPIQKARVSKTTAHYVWVMYNAGKTVRKERKLSRAYRNYFPSWTEARAHLILRATKRADASVWRMEKDQKELLKMLAIPPKEPEE